MVGISRGVCVVVLGVVGVDNDGVVVVGVAVVMAALLVAAGVFVVSAIPGGALVGVCCNVVGVNDISLADNGSTSSRAAADDGGGNGSETSIMNGFLLDELARK